MLLRAKILDLRELRTQLDQVHEHKRILEIEISETRAIMQSLQGKI